MPDPDDDLDDLDDDPAADDTQTELDIRYRLDEPDPPGMADTGNESDDSFFTEGKEDPMTPPADPTPTQEQLRAYRAWTLATCLTNTDAERAVAFINAVRAAVPTLGCDGPPPTPSAATVAVPRDNLWRKKPVVVEARQWPRIDRNGPIDAIAKPFRDWIGDDFTDFWQDGILHGRIATLEGPHTASPGDWIIKGVKGEFYPCKPDIFAATYEPAAASPAPAAPGGGEARDLVWLLENRRDPTNGWTDEQLCDAAARELKRLYRLRSAPASQGESVRVSRAVATAWASVAKSFPREDMVGVTLAMLDEIDPQLASPPEPTRGETAGKKCSHCGGGPSDHDAKTGTCLSCGCIASWPPVASPGVNSTDEEPEADYHRGYAAGHAKAMGDAAKCLSAPPPNASEGAAPTEPKPASDPLEAEDIACIRKERADFGVVLMNDDSYVDVTRRWPWASYGASGPEVIAAARHVAALPAVASRRPRLYQRIDSEWKSVPLVEPASPPPVEGKATATMPPCPKCGTNDAVSTCIHASDLEFGTHYCGIVHMDDAKRGGGCGNYFTHPPTPPVVPPVGTDECVVKRADVQDALAIAARLGSNYAALDRLSAAARVTPSQEGRE